MDRPERVRQLLAARSLTLSAVSQQSAKIFGRSSRFYVPHNLYRSVRDPSFIPTIHQMLALSHITDYGLTDWLAVFGCHLDQIPRLQTLLPRPHTALLDSSVYDRNAWVPWFTGRPNVAQVPPIAPLSWLLAAASPKRAADLLAFRKRRFLYGKVGEQDRWASPYLAPGAVVRVDTERVDLPLNTTNREGPFFFLERERGYTCSRLVALAKDRILLQAPQLSCGAQELRLGTDARILGIIDAELRSVADDTDVCEMPRSTAPKSLSARSPNPESNLRDLLLAARIRAGLSFREASSASRWIAKMLCDTAYFAAPSTLSDYETLSEPPRHIQKVITLCVLYGIEFRQFLRVSGLPLEREGRDAMPDELALRKAPSPGPAPRMGNEEGGHGEQSSFVSRFLEQGEEIPLFLRYSLAELTGIKSVSLSDLFWVGGDRAPIHPLLMNAKLIAVNRRMKKTIRSASKTFCDKPLHLVLRREGGYLCGYCVLEGRSLVVHSYPGGPGGTQIFRNQLDAEIVGRVTTVLRRV
jgi:hypothetical protein